MDQQTKSFAITSPALISHHELGWQPSAMGRHQISLAGLDDGTYSVAVVVPGSEVERTIVTGKTEAEITTTDLIVGHFKITLAGLGEDADPVVTFTATPRRA